MATSNVHARVVSFRQFLLTYESPSSLGDPIADLGRELRDEVEYTEQLRREGDPDVHVVPTADAALFRHLMEKPGLPDKVVEAAWLRYLGGRS